MRSKLLANDWQANLLMHINSGLTFLFRKEKLQKKLSHRLALAKFLAHSLKFLADYREKIS